MTQINVKRAVLSGFVAGIFIFIITGITNGAVLRTELNAWVQHMGSLVRPPQRAVAMSLWAIMCLIFGVVGVWIYAGMRPRYGAGLKSALRAGLLLWLASKLAVALDFVALGLLPGRIVIGQLIGGFVAIMIATVVGARLYKE
jgi:hypothetical protein